ncbi:MAG: hypothetical protein V3R93_04820 [Candidatus Hydrothermarchaeaceae archaeon]
MRKISYICLFAGSFLALSCSYLTDIGGGGSSTDLQPRGPVSLDKNDYPVFPDADAGADSSVSAEEGGKGFTGEGWETNTDFDFIGDPRAVKGGLLREAMSDFPGTLRIVGPESNTMLNSMLGGMVYETLLSLHPTTLEYISRPGHPLANLPRQSNLSLPNQPQCPLGRWPTGHGRGRRGLLELQHG